MSKIMAGRWRRISLRVLGAVGVSVVLSGCIVEPLYPPHPYHPYRYGYYGY